MNLNGRRNSVKAQWGKFQVELNFDTHLGIQMKNKFTGAQFRAVFNELPGSVLSCGYKSLVDLYNDLYDMLSPRSGIRVHEFVNQTDLERFQILDNGTIKISKGPNAQDQHQASFFGLLQTEEYVSEMSSEIQDQKRQIELLQNQVSILKSRVQTNFAGTNHKLSSFSSDRYTRRNRLMKQSLELLKKMELVQINGFYCDFYLRSQRLQIFMLNCQNGDEFFILVQDDRKKQLSSQNSQMTYGDFEFIIKNNSIEKKLKISSQGVFTIIRQREVQDRYEPFEYYFYGQKVECCPFKQIQKMRWLQKKKEENQNNKRFAALSQELKQQFLNELSQKQIHYNLKYDSIRKQFQNRLSQAQKSHNLKFDQMKQQCQNKLSQAQKNYNLKFDQMKQQFQKKLSHKLQIQKKLIVKEDWQDSKIISNLNEYNTLINFFDKDKQSKYLNKYLNKSEQVKIQLKLLFRASQHGFSAAEFHNKCDNVPHTLVLIKTNFNKIIGGYTPLKWNNDVHGPIKDYTLSSFIFSLTNGDKFKLEKPEYAINSRVSQGPSFGIVPPGDIAICDKSNKRNSSCYPCHSYKNANYTYNNQQSWTKFQGSTQDSQFLTIQYQVYQVILKS